MTNNKEKNYSLTKTDIAKEKEKGVLATALRRLVPLMVEEKNAVIISIIAILASSAVSLVVPIIIAHIVDVYITAKNFHGILSFSALLAVIFIVGVITNYVQIITMGGVGPGLCLI